MLLVKAKRTHVPRKLLIMVTKIFRIIMRKWLLYVKFVGNRKYVLLLPPLVLLLFVLWPTLWWFLVRSSWAQLQPRSEHSEQYKMNRSLQYYMQRIELLVEPTVLPCGNHEEVPVIIMVASILPHSDQRKVIRDTWGIYQPTYFVMGLTEEEDRQLLTNYKEADLYNDLLVFDFSDRNLNQTLKTALMMKWILDHCPQAQFLFKTEDDVMVNPWTLNKVLLENFEAEVVGYSLNNTHVLRNECKNMYISQEASDDEVPRYLSGTGYLIRWNYIEMILRKAYQVPVLNLEDVYYTYLVAHKKLGLTLTHDKRLSPYKPWLKTACIYWGMASIHGLNPDEMLKAWSYIDNLVMTHKKIADICKFFNVYFNLFRDPVLY